VVAVVAGVLLFFGALGLGTAGGVALAIGAQREGGFVTSPRATVVSSTAVVTSEALELHAQRGALDRIGVGDVRFTAAGAGTYFLGIARRTDVDHWLAGTAYDRVNDVTGRAGIRLDRVAGDVRAVGAPQDQTFWLASATGSGTVTMNWTMTEGTFVVVLANADGGTGVATDVSVAARIPDPTPLGVGLLAAGLLVLLASIALIYLGASGLGRGGPASPTARPPQAPPPTTNDPAQLVSTR
jgi:hypothetical protein